MTLSADEHRVIAELEAQWSSSRRPRVLTTVRRAGVAAVGLVMLTIGLLLDSVVGQVFAVLSFVVIVAALGWRQPFRRWP